MKTIKSSKCLDFQKKLPFDVFMIKINKSGLICEESPKTGIMTEPRVFPFLSQRSTLECFQVVHS